MGVFAPSAKCPHCECPRGYDFTHSRYNAYVCLNPICSINVDEMSATTHPGGEGPLNPESWPYPTTIRSLGWYATTTSSTGCHTPTRVAVKQERVVGAAPVAVKQEFVGAATVAVQQEFVGAATVAVQQEFVGAAPVAVNQERVVPAAIGTGTLLQGTEGGGAKRAARKAGPRHSSKKALARNKVTAANKTNKANKAAAAAPQQKAEATQAVPAMKTVLSSADAAPPAAPARKIARVEQTTPARELPMMPTTLPPWEEPSMIPAERIPYQRDMYWPVGKLTVRKNHNDVGKMSDLGPQGKLCAQAIAFTRVVEQGQMLPPTLSVPGMPSYTIREYTDVLGKMLTAYQCSGE